MCCVFMYMYIHHNKSMTFLMALLHFINLWKGLGVVEKKNMVGGSVITKRFVHSIYITLPHHQRWCVPGRWCGTVRHYYQTGRKKNNNNNNNK